MARRGHARRKTIFSAILLTTAAALLSPVALMSAWVHAESPSTQVFSTVLGEFRSVVLDDLLAVRMNTATAMAVTSNAQAREVALDRGEALFELQQDGTRLLLVAAGNTIVSTRAAIFSVHLRDPKNLDVMVTAGQITVGTTTMHKNQLARVSPGGTVVRDIDDAEASRKLQWVDRYIAFSGETLAEAVAEFNRYNVRKLVIADRTISTLAIGGHFRTTDVDSFVAALRPIGVQRMKADAANGDDAIRLVSSQRKD